MVLPVPRDRQDREVHPEENAFNGDDEQPEIG